MDLLLPSVRLRLEQADLLPAGKLALFTWYLLALDLLLFVLERVLARFKSSYGESLTGWVTFLTLVVMVLFAVLTVRWLREKLLWRLRNRLIVTWVFIGVIPSILLVSLTLVSFYVLAGQFAAFIVTSRLDGELETLRVTNADLARELGARLERGEKPALAPPGGERPANGEAGGREVCVWADGKLILHDPPNVPSPERPSYLNAGFTGVVRDHDQLFLRSAETLLTNGQALTVLSSEPLAQQRLQGLAHNLGEVTLLSGASSGGLTSTYSAGTIPPPTRSLDRQVSLPATVKTIKVTDWNTGDTSRDAAIAVETRYSKLGEWLFSASGDFAATAEMVLLLLLVVFALIELTALLIGVRLTRTVTGAVAQLYDATQHVNRGRFHHRIPVQSRDQLAALANSFNSMTESLERLLMEHEEKQRMENELVIAQEVQAQLFPRHIKQLPSLEVFGFCRPARTVSGDYYDFVPVEAEKLLIAVGDISGKGISAALLMATVHSAVRALSLEGIPVLHEPVAVGAGLGSSMVLDSTSRGAEVSPATLLALLNHQLYESTPMEKYATLFLGVYDEEKRRLIYSNGGHLPPIILGGDRSVRRLDQGGTVIGLFDHRVYDEASVQLGRGDIFLAYSDGVTEPENDYGEFGEKRLIELVSENRDLPLARISEIVSAAVDDWIGAGERPDDITLVLARAR